MATQNDGKLRSGGGTPVESPSNGPGVVAPKFTNEQKGGTPNPQKSTPKFPDGYTGK